MSTAQDDYDATAHLKGKRTTAEIERLIAQGLTEAAVDVVESMSEETS